MIRHAVSGSHLRQIAKAEERFLSTQANTFAEANVKEKSWPARSEMTVLGKDEKRSTDGKGCPGSSVPKSGGEKPHSTPGTKRLWMEGEGFGMVRGA